MDSAPDFRLVSTLGLGVLELGILFGILFFGILILQVYIYSICNSDRALVKLLVCRFLVPLSDTELTLWI